MVATPRLSEAELGAHAGDELLVMREEDIMGVIEG